MGSVSARISPTIARTSNTHNIRYRAWFMMSKDTTARSLLRTLLTLKAAKDVGSKKKPDADFTDALVNEDTDIPERKVFGERRLS